MKAIPGTKIATLGGSLKVKKAIYVSVFHPKGFIQEETLIQIYLIG